MKNIKKIKLKVIIAALAAGLLVFAFAFADKNEAPYSRYFHRPVTESKIYKGLEALDFKINDAIYQPDNEAVLDIMVIGIDQASMDAIGKKWTEWPRSYYAQLLDKLHDEKDPADPTDDVGPAVVCFDILFDGSDDPEDDRLYAEACAKYGDTIQAAYYKLERVPVGVGVISWEMAVTNTTLPYPALMQSAVLGLSNNAISDDGYARTLFVDHFTDKPIDSLAVAAYKAYLEYHGETYVPHRYIAEGEDTIYFTYSRGTQKNGKPFEYKSFADALEYDDLADYVNGRIVFVGGYEAGMSDDFFTPAGSIKMNGVDIHANTCEAIAQGKLQIPASRTVTALVYSLICMALVFIVSLTSLPVSISCSAATIVLDMVANYIARKNGIYLQVVYLIIPALIIIVSAIVIHYLTARAEKAKINNAFKMYVAPEVVDEMAGSGSYELKLGGQTKDIAVLFIDIRGFTTMSEGLHPEEVVSILNEYFGLVTDSIFKNKGTLDKFIGDAAMAVFNSPNDLDDYVYRAVHTAWDIALGSQTLAAKLLEKHGRTITYGIGVNCGPATIGNIGSEFRMDFTAIGDTVNTSARLEANAKAGQILISKAVFDIVKDWVETEDIGTIPLKGKSNEVYVYNVTKVIDKPGYLEKKPEEGKKAHKRKR